MDRTSFDALAELELGVRELTLSGRWQEFLRMQATFHRYSYRNVLLILRQCPHATQVAGFRSWRALGRNVRRGERAIWILAPKQQREGEQCSARSIIGFVPVPVFDISQTAGRPLPEVCRRLEGPAEVTCFTRLARVSEGIGFEVQLAELRGGVNGECSHVDRLIRIECRNAPAQRVKSLAHELAHAHLHEDIGDRVRAELEAESVAFVVCRRLGLETGEYSFGYLASWAGDAERAALEIRGSCSRIVSTADSILESYDRMTAADRVR